LTSNCGHAVLGLAAWPNWYQRPDPEYSIDFTPAAPSASADD
jgi:hypothetical protein